jgi:hypothetical protein
MRKYGMSVLMIKWASPTLTVVPASNMFAHKARTEAFINVGLRLGPKYVGIIDERWAQIKQL